MKENLTTTEYNVVERNGQLLFTLNTEKKIPEDAPVRLTDAQLEELDYRKLYAAFSSKGRNPVTDPRVLFKVLAYANQLHIYSNRQIVDACENRIDMIWLLDGEAVPDQSTIARFKRRCAEEIEDLFYQYDVVVSHYRCEIAPVARDGQNAARRPTRRNQRSCGRESSIWRSGQSLRPTYPQRKGFS